MLYIPGNHDPLSLFSGPDAAPKLSTNDGANVHKSIKKVGDNLYVIGLGGCVQNFVQKDGVGALEKCWDPFPYGEEDHSRFNADLDELWAKVPENAQVIVMTHDGPSGSSTAKNTRFDMNMTTYHAGSPHLRKLLLQHREQVVCSVHGHTHEGSFIQNISKPAEVLPIINPGSLGQGEFGIITLR